MSLTYCCVTLHGFFHIFISHVDFVLNFRFSASRNHASVQGVWEELAQCQLPRVLPYGLLQPQLPLLTTYGATAAASPHLQVAPPGEVTYQITHTSILLISQPQVTFNQSYVVSNTGLHTSLLSSSMDIILRVTISSIHTLILIELLVILRYICVITTNFNIYSRPIYS